MSMLILPPTSRSDPLGLDVEHTLTGALAGTCHIHTNHQRGVNVNDLSCINIQPRSRNCDIFNELSKDDCHSPQHQEISVTNIPITASRTYMSRECAPETILLSSFKQLLKMYSMHANDHGIGATSSGADSEQPLILTGGLQQFLIKNMKAQKENCLQPVKGVGSEMTTFHDLPDSTQLHIFSYLNAQDLCRISKVCRHWYCIAADNILWRDRLRIDIRQWDVIGHTTNPQMYRECQSDWTNKEIYLRCSPEVNKMIKKTNMNFHQLSSMLRAIWPKKTPRVAMFGPGLESKTSQITRKILEDKSGMFKTTGMFPGQFEGLGSGFTMKMSSITFHLMTLYTSTRQERESRPRDQRLQHSRLLAQNPQNADGDRDQQAAEDSDDEDGDDNQYEVTNAVKELCHTLDAFIFVFDASQDEETARSARAELLAMVNDKWVKPGVPVVVLSCIPDVQSSRVACNDVVNILKLAKLSRPWQVRDCIVDRMTGVVDAIEWVAEQAQRTG